jgi:hypothetical protein
MEQIRSFGTSSGLKGITMVAGWIGSSSEVLSQQQSTTTISINNKRQ